MDPERPRPQVVAHRGSSDEHAEHTLGAYVAALEAGADALECDVRLTADGHLVCVHDRNLKRTANRPDLVSTTTLDDLSHLDFAAWKTPWAELDDEAPERDVELGRVLTLRRLFETVAACDRRVEVAVETKHPTRYGGLVEKRVVELLRDFGWDRGDTPVRVMSFSTTALQRVEKLAPAVPLVQLLERRSQWPIIKRVMGPDWIVGPGIALLREHPKLGRKIRRTGREVHVWTVNTADDLAICQEIGVQAVITDKPAHLRALLEMP